MALQEVDEDRVVARSAVRLVATNRSPGVAAGDLKTRAEKVAAVAATHAAAVDAGSRFPSEAIGAARAERLLSAAVPADLGGEGASIADVVDVCYALGRACASTAMIYAMHQVKVACLVRHGRSSAWHQWLLRRLGARPAAAGLVDHRRRAAAMSAPARRRSSGDGGRIAGARTPPSSPMAKPPRHRHHGAPRRRSRELPTRCWSLSSRDDYTLERLNGWDALGMRGTCSAGFALTRVRRRASRSCP